MAKYLMLDIDGVLNNSFYCKCHEDDYARLDPKNLQIFADFIHKNPEIRIVLSSDWKQDFNENLQPYKDYVSIMTNEGPREFLSRATKLLLAFEEYNLKLYDKTPLAGRSSRYDWYWERCDEIKWYIEEHLTEDDEYVIVDDNDNLYGNEYLSKDFKGHFVQTKYTEGLRPKDIDKIKEILKIKE